MPSEQDNFLNPLETTTNFNREMGTPKTIIFYNFHENKYLGGEDRCYLFTHEGKIAEEAQYIL